MRGQPHNKPQGSKGFEAMPIDQAL